ncbi:hypothetical protein [Streptomyces sparsus]
MDKPADPTVFGPEYDPADDPQSPRNWRYLPTPAELHAAREAFRQSLAEAKADRLF